MVLSLLNWFSHHLRALTAAFIVIVFVLSLNGAISEAYQGIRDGGALRQQAEAQARQFWEARITKCGDDHFTRNRELIHQFKNLEIIVTVLSVTQADRLNGIEWRGRTAISAGPSRVYSSKRTFNHDIGWSKWSEGLGDALGVVGLNAEIRKEHGQWFVLPSSISPASNFQPISCTSANNPADPGSPLPVSIRDEGTATRIVRIGSQRARVLFNLGFWESSGAAGSKQTMGTRFAQSEVRFVNWRLFVSWDQPIESRLTNDLKAVWFRINDDNTLRRYDWSEQTGGRVVQMVKGAAEFSNGKGWREPGQWEKGRWKVKIYQNDVLIIDGQFEIY